ncbi:hypothetical protein F5882DRAFT_438370 [Hyaloscypha sp. PMI_1271]|nr:hypothetical protein F5882DRAFT_438370 [Hyaloscypha sp. PMI_1271]
MIRFDRLKETPDVPECCSKSVLNREKIDLGTIRLQDQEALRKRRGRLCSIRPGADLGWPVAWLHTEGVVVEKLPAAHMKIYLSIGGLGLSGSKWQQVAANRYFDSTIDAVKSRWGSGKKGGKKMRVDTELEAFEGLASRNNEVQEANYCSSSQSPGRGRGHDSPSPTTSMQCTSSTVHRVCSNLARSPAIHTGIGTDGEEEPGKLIGASGRQNLRDVDTPVIPQVIPWLTTLRSRRRSSPRDFSSKQSGPLSLTFDAVEHQEDPTSQAKARMSRGNCFLNTSMNMPERITHKVNDIKAAFSGSRHNVFQALQRHVQERPPVQY